MEFGLVPVAAVGHAIADDEVSARIADTVAELSAAGITVDAVESPATDAEAAREALDAFDPERLDAIAVLLLTGGTERTIIDGLAHRPEPIVLLGTSAQNSFAAAVEARAGLEAEGVTVELVFADDLDRAAAADLQRSVAADRITDALGSFRLGLIGEQSPWLVSGTGEPAAALEGLGPELVQVPMDAVLEAVAEVPAARRQEIAATFETGVADTVEPDHDALVEAAGIYEGLRRIADDHDLDAITVGCFELIPELGNTACFALAKLIDDGLVAGCEGDVQATMSMELLHRVGEGPTWMANTVAPAEDADRLTFAHCTIATEMLAGPPTLRSHFESGTGVAIEGALAERAVTLARLGGESLDRLFVATGEVTDGALGREDMCRTQATIELDGDVDEYVENTLGNHVAIAYGDLTADLEAVAEALELSVVGIS